MSEPFPLQPQPPRPSLVENEGVNAGSRAVPEDPVRVREEPEDAADTSGGPADRP